MITGLWIFAIVLIIFGLYRLSHNHRTEGILELIFGILEIVVEILTALA